MPHLRVLFLLLALVLFLVAAYRSATLADKLTRVAFVLLVLAWIWP